MSAVDPTRELDGKGGDALLNALWKRIEDAWDEDKPHHAALEYAIRSEQLPELAGRYRAVTEDPARADRAKKKLDAVVVAATQILYSMKTPTRKGVPPALTLAAGAVCVLILGWVAFALFGK